MSCTTSVSERMTDKLKQLIKWARKDKLGALGWLLIFIGVLLLLSVASPMSTVGFSFGAVSLKAEGITSKSAVSIYVGLFFLIIGIVLVARRWIKNAMNT